MEDNAMVVGGMFDNILKGLLFNLKPDFSKLDKVKFKQGVGLALDSFKPTISGSLDDMLIDAAKNALESVIDGLGVKQDGPLVVSAGRRRSRQDVEDMILAEGGDPATFAPWLLLVLQFLPTAIDLIRKLLGK
jgi:hypothetical protein